MTATELFARAQRFDIIHLGDVLEHLPAPAQTLRGLAPLLSDHGVFFIEGPLERQTSLVYVAASSAKILRRLLRLDREGSVPPYHLTLTDWTSQRRFFERTLDFSPRAVEIYETGWPYTGGGVRGLIGRAAVALAATRMGRRLSLGNRFKAIVVPRAISRDNL